MGAVTNPVDNSHSVHYRGQVEVLQTALFRDWLNGLRDRKARPRIDDRLNRLTKGNADDTKPVGDGVLINLLNGGEKVSQARDIAKAKRLAKEACDGIEGLSV